MDCQKTIVVKSHPLFILVIALMCNAVTAQDEPFIYVLGITQDAGYPQAGCYQQHCLAGWENPELRLGDTYIAVVDPAANNKYLFEATPHLPEQLYNLEKVAPDKRYTLDGVFLTHAHMGHYTGLMYFGFESMNVNNLPVYTMPRMAEFLKTNGPWSQLVTMNNIELQSLENRHSVKVSNITVTPMLVPHRDEFSETVGYQIDGPNKTALFIPDIDKWEIWERDILEEIRQVDYAMVDATFFDENELPGRNMSDIPHPFVVESMELFEDLSETDKNKVIFIHLNHSNPLLDRESAAYQQIVARGFKVAKEGDHLPL